MNTTAAPSCGISETTCASPRTKTGIGGSGQSASNGSLSVASTPDENHMTGMGFSLVPEVASLKIIVSSVEPSLQGGGRMQDAKGGVTDVSQKEAYVSGCLF